MIPLAIGCRRSKAAADQTGTVSGETIMQVKDAARDVMAAVALMEQARNACANLSPLGLPMSDAQIEHRARVIAAVIKASRKLQQLRDRAVSLESALARFRARKAELAA